MSEVDLAISVMTERGYLPMARRIWAACWEMHPQQYRHSGPTPEKAWPWLDPSQRLLFLHYAAAAYDFLGNHP